MGHTSTRSASFSNVTGCDMAPRGVGRDWRAAGEACAPPNGRTLHMVTSIRAQRQVGCRVGERARRATYGRPAVLAESGVAAGCVAGAAGAASVSASAVAAAFGAGTTAGMVGSAGSDG